MTMQVAQGLTIHTIVLVVEKRERGIASQTLLTKLGFKVVVATGLYDALKIVEQELPHLVICEVTLTDGTCVHLFDKLQQNKLLAKTPIMGYSVKKSPDEIAMIKSRKLAGAYAGQIEPKTFFAEINKIIANYSPISPFYFGATQCGLVEDLTLKMESTVLGRVGDQLLMRGATEVDQNASMLCVPKSPDLAPAVLRMASNTKNGEEIFNLFPLSRVVGKGRTWMDKLPVISLDRIAAATQAASAGVPAAPQMRKVIFYDPNEARADGFKEILAGYDIELVYAKTLTLAAQLLSRSPDAISGVYLHEMLNDASSIEWKNAYAKIPASSRPSTICGTTAAAAKNTDNLRYIKRPFGMGVLVEMMEATFAKGKQLASVASASVAPASSGVAVSLQAPAKLVGLDETGGVLQMKFPVVKGSKVEIGHDFIQGLIGASSVTIVSALPLPSQPDVYQARFESIGPGMSKAKYWEKISKVLSDKAATVAAAKAAAEAADPQAVAS